VATRTEVYRLNELGDQVAIEIDDPRRRKRGRSASYVASIGQDEHGMASRLRARRRLSVCPSGRRPSPRIPRAVDAFFIQRRRHHQRVRFPTKITARDAGFARLIARRTPVAGQRVVGSAGRSGIGGRLKRATSTINLIA